MSDESEQTMSSAEAELSDRVKKAAQRAINGASFLIFVAFLFGGAVGVGMTKGEDQFVGLGIGCVCGLVLGIVNYLRVAATMLNIQRAQLFMDRN